MIEDVFAGQLGNEERACGVPARCTAPDLGLVPLKPEELRTDRLAGKRRSGVGENFLNAVTPVELFDLGRCARIDAVQNCGAQRSQIAIARKKARTDTAHRDGGDLRCRVAHELATGTQQPAPPGVVCIVLSPIDTWQIQPVGAFRPPDDLPLHVGQYSLRASRAYVDAQNKLAHRADPKPSNSMPRKADTRRNVSTCSPGTAWMWFAP